MLVVFGIATPAIAHRFESAATPVRILIAVGILLPVGFCMGMAFPLGMRAALQRSPSIAPWLWGVNGATSVCASVLAVVIAIGAGISAAFWVGTLCYLVALLALPRQLPRTSNLPTPKGSQLEPAGTSKSHARGAIRRDFRLQLLRPSFLGSWNLGAWSVDDHATLC